MKNRRRSPIHYALFFVLFVFVAGGLVMFLWNLILPDVIPGVAELNYWQALGILVLSKMLFGGFGPSSRSNWHHHPREEKVCGHLSPEEKERLKERFISRMQH